MRLADYVIKFIQELDIKDVFLVSGGGNMHLIDAVGRNKNINYICNHHEQACTIASEGYARMRNYIGVSIVTTGPGGTNAITGVAGAWLDSIPMLVISGQVKTSDMVDNSGTSLELRQFGDQEINIVDMVKPITKYAVTVTEKKKIKYHLKKAVYLALTGRPGPVWVDIPLDIQAAQIEESDLADYVPVSEQFDIDSNIKEIIEQLKDAKRPIIIAGNGIRLSKGAEIFLDMLKITQIPVITAINGNDLVNDEYEWYCGRFGIQGQRGANFAVLNSDFIISIGTRLNLRQIGYNHEKFAPHAKKIIVDIDQAELEKKSCSTYFGIRSDAYIFIEKFNYYYSKITNSDLNIRQWQEQCKKLNSIYNGIDKEHEDQIDFVNSYYFIREISKFLSSKDHIITSNGTANISTMFAMKLKKGQRMFTNTGLASMGYGLPAAIGACISNDRKQVICFENDGSLQMNIQELQTIVHYNLPIKMFVFNNEGYLSIKITQKNNFPDNITAADPNSGVSCPDLEKISYAYGIPFYRISDKQSIDNIVSNVLDKEGYCICEIMMDPFQELTPKVSSRKLEDGSMVSTSIEDMYPFFSRELYNKIMDECTNEKNINNR